MTDARLSTVVAQVAATVTNANARVSTVVGQAAVVISSATVPARISTVVGQTIVRQPNAMNDVPGPPSSLVVSTDITGKNLLLNFAASDSGNANGYEYRLDGGAWIDGGTRRPIIIPGALWTTYVIDLRAYGYAGVSSHITATFTTGSVGREIILSSRNFSVPSGVTLLDLVMAGGGGGAGKSRNGAGGGGAGGVKHPTGLAVDPGASLPAVIGAGGAGSAGSTTSDGSPGGDTTFLGQTAHGGSGGGGQNQNAPGGGGSGGGAPGHSGTTFIGGAGIAGEGNKGGNGKENIIVNSRSGGGGGGAGADGLNGTGGASPGNGGAGVNAAPWLGGAFLYASPVGPGGELILIPVGEDGWIGGGGAGGRTSQAGGAVGAGGQGGGGDGRDGDTATGYAGLDGSGGGGGAGGANGSLGTAGTGGQGASGLLVITYDQPDPFGAPGDPVDVTLLAIDAEEALIGWSPPLSGGPVHHYEVRLNGGAAYAADSDSTHRFSGLVPEYPYTFEVRAIGVTGQTSNWVAVLGTTDAIPGDWEKPLGNALRLEIQEDPKPGQLVNLVQNPSGDLGAYGWISPVPGSRITSTLIPGSQPLRTLVYRAEGGVANYCYTEPLPCVPGDYAAAAWNMLSWFYFGPYRARFEYLDVTGAFLAAETPTGYIVPDASMPSYGPWPIPAGAEYLRLRFDFFADSSGSPPATTGDEWRFLEVTVVTAETSTELGSARANAIANPSFETGTFASWSGSGACSFAIVGAPAHGTYSAQIDSASSSYVDNLVVNPSFETSTFGWLGGSGMTLSIVSYEHWHNSNSLLATMAVPGGTVNGAWTWTGRGYDWNIPCNPGQRLYIRARMQAKNSAQNWEHPYLAVGFMFNVGATPLQTFYVAQWNQDGTRGIWHDLWGSVVVPAGATFARPAFRFAEYPSAIHGGNYHGFVDAVQVTYDSPVPSYFDGSTPDSANEIYDWLGTPYESMSRKTTRYPVANAGLYAAQVDVVPGRAYTLSTYARASAPLQLYAVLYFYNAAGALLAAPGGLIHPGLSGGFERAQMTVSAPPGATKATALLYTPTLAPPTVFWLDAVQLEIGSSATDFLVGSVSDADLSYVEPILWLDILGSAHEISVTRRALDVGSLAAEVIDPALDPSVSLAPLIRPGHACRLTGRIGEEWRPIFTGAIVSSEVAYVLTDPDEQKRVRVTMSAADSIQKLANQTRAETVSSIGELPATMEGAGVPWNINGSGDQVASYTVAAKNDSASVLDQIAIVRDSGLGYAWVNRFGVLTAWDRALIPADPLNGSSELVGEPLTEEIYADLQIGYTTEQLINEVTLRVLSWDGATSTETISGPYRDNASIRTWGVRRAEFAIAGVADPAAYAASVLAANGTPLVRLLSMRLRVDPSADWSEIGEHSWFAWTDLYDLVEVNCERAGIVEAPARVIAITHRISSPDNKWMIDLGFADDGIVASPSIAPRLPTVPGAAGPMGPMGIQGIQGEQGPPAPSTVQGIWNWLAPATTADTVGATRIGVNHDSPSLATELIAHKEAATFGADFGLYFSSLQAGDRIYLQNKTTAESWHVYLVTGPAVLKGTTSGPLTTWHVPVTTDAGTPTGTEPANGSDVLVVLSVAAIPILGSE